MSSHQLGLWLRVLGPLVEIVGLALFFGGRTVPARVLGIGAQTMGLYFLAMGLAMVIAGLWLSFSSKRNKAQKGEESDEFGLRL